LPEVLEFVRTVLLARAVKIIYERLHPDKARVVKPFENVQGGKEECTGTTCRVKNRCATNGFVEGSEGFGAFAVRDDFLGKATTVEVVCNKLIDRANLARFQFVAN